jgi:hypothetical protein
VVGAGHGVVFGEDYPVTEQIDKGNLLMEHATPEFGIAYSGM